LSYSQVLLYGFVKRRLHFFTRVVHTVIVAWLSQEALAVLTPALVYVVWVVAGAPADQTGDRTAAKGLWSLIYAV
jgi:hypothetical protein